MQGGNYFQTLLDNNGRTNLPSLPLQSSIDFRSESNKLSGFEFQFLELFAIVLVVPMNLWELGSGL
jgi:hypothetical protein